MDAIIERKDLVVLTRASGQRIYISMPHRANKNGSSTLGEMVRCVALLGFKDSVVPATLETDPLMDIKEDENVPKLSFLATLKSEDNVFRKMDMATETEKAKIGNSTILLPWISKKI
mmetsp:Transcript_12171/g.16266  ORF Transcript_12171/g.16266 Transcript_12171/m.16266 type:complete len:117 (+) Transcript_12171:392-742(+)